MKRGWGRGHDNRGYFTLLAVFLITILCVLGVYMSRILSSNTSATAMSVRQAQVQYAARSGMEWAIHRIRRGGVHDTLCATPAAQTSFTLSGGTVANTLVIVACDDQRVGGFDEGGVVGEVDQVRVTARRGSLGDSGLAQHALTEIVAPPN